MRVCVTIWANRPYEGLAMTTPDQETVTCPDCGKGYRFKSALVGQAVPCKACGTTFEIPMKPGKGLLPQPAEDDGLYELAGDPDDEPELPPAHVIPKADPTPAPPTPKPAPPPAETKPARDLGGANNDDSSEPAVHVSEAAKAARREEQRIAAAQAASVRSWRDYKWLIMIIALLCLLGLIYWAMHLFSDAVDEGLHKTMLPDHQAIAIRLNTLSPEVPA